MTGRQDSGGSTVRRLQLGARLRELRLAKGVSREDAYRLVQRNAMKVWESDGALSLQDLLKADAEVTAALSAAEIDDKFDLGYHYKHVDTIFERVFGR